MATKEKNVTKPTKTKKTKSKATKPKKKVEKVELYSDYTLQSMFEDLNKLQKLCERLGHTNIILNVILTKARISNIYDPLQAIQRAKILETDKEVKVQILEYNNNVV